MNEDEKEWLKRLGANVREMRIAKLGERSKSKLQEISGVTRETIRLLESGDSNPTATILLSIASALDCKVSDLIP